MESKRYYLKVWGNPVVIGPYTFKEAIKRHEKYRNVDSVPHEILKVVVDANGDEVK